MDELGAFDCDFPIGGGEPQNTLDLGAAVLRSAHCFYDIASPPPISHSTITIPSSLPVATAISSYCSFPSPRETEFSHTRHPRTCETNGDH
jgi:hypothetical protein